MRPAVSPFGQLSQWSVAFGNMSPEPLLAELPGWDARSQCTCIRTIAIDSDNLCQESGLDSSQTTLKVAVTAETGGGRLKEVVWEKNFPPQTSERVRLEISFGVADASGIMGTGVLAGDLVLRTGVYLVSGAEVAAPLTAARAGSVLWSDAHHIRLEGPDAGVPIMAVSFKKPFLGITASAADYFISLEAIRDANSQFRSSVMVYANTDTGFEQRLADAEPSALALVYQGLVTQLCMHLLLNGMLSESDVSFDPGTVGAVAAGVLTTAFPEKSMASITQMIRARPAEFMVRMQDSAIRATGALHR